MKKDGREKGARWAESRKGSGAEASGRRIGPRPLGVVKAEANERKDREKRGKRAAMYVRAGPHIARETEGATKEKREETYLYVGLSEGFVRCRRWTLCLVKHVSHRNAITSSTASMRPTTRGGTPESGGRQLYRHAERC
jgi:hypothetical protein